MEQIAKLAVRTGNGDDCGLTQRWKWAKQKAEETFSEQTERLRDVLFEDDDEPR